MLFILELLSNHKLVLLTVHIEHKAAIFEHYLSNDNISIFSWVYKRESMIILSSTIKIKVYLIRSKQLRNISQLVLTHLMLKIDLLFSNIGIFIYFTMMNQFRDELKLSITWTSEPRYIFINFKWRKRGVENSNSCWIAKDANFIMIKNFIIIQLL